MSLDGRVIQDRAEVPWYELDVHYLICTLKGAEPRFIDEYNLFTTLSWTSDLSRNCTLIARFPCGTNEYCRTLTCGPLSLKRSMLPRWLSCHGRPPQGDASLPALAVSAPLRVYNYAAAGAVLTCPRELSAGAPATLECQVTLTETTRPEPCGLGGGAGLEFLQAPATNNPTLAPNMSTANFKLSCLSNSSECTFPTGSLGCGCTRRLAFSNHTLVFKHEYTLVPSDLSLQNITWLCRQIKFCPNHSDWATMAANCSITAEYFPPLELKALEAAMEVLSQNYILVIS